MWKTNWPNVPLPPQPVVTRWGTWLSASVYYADNFETVYEAVHMLNSEDAESIIHVQQSLSAPNIQNQLAFIKANFSFLIVSITELQAAGMHLAKGLQIIKKVNDNLENLTDNSYLSKFKKIVNRNNSGFNTIKAINRIIEGKSINVVQTSNTAHLLPDEIAAYKYCPIQSCDVERTFSMYKTVLSDKRRSFVFENLKKHLILCCNQNLDKANQANDENYDL